MTTRPKQAGMFRRQAAVKIRQAPIGLRGLGVQVEAVPNLRSCEPIYEGAPSASMRRPKWIKMSLSLPFRRSEFWQ
jgi:hypothetical protein